MADQKIRLTIISQEQQLVSTDVDSVSVPTTQGEITVLPSHIPLFAKIETGELIFRLGTTATSVVVSKGFLDMSPQNELTIMVDSAIHEREVSLEKAQAAVAAAHATMAQPTVSQRELILAEGSLRRALLEIKVAQRTKSASKI